MDEEWKRHVLQRHFDLDMDCELKLVWSGVRNNKCFFHVRGSYDDKTVAECPTNMAYQINPIATLNVCVQRSGWVPILCDRVEEEELRWFGLKSPLRQRHARVVTIEDVLDLNASYVSYEEDNTHPADEDSFTTLDHAFSLEIGPQSRCGNDTAATTDVHIRDSVQEKSPRLRRWQQHASYCKWTGR